MDIREVVCDDVYNFEVPQNLVRLWAFGFAMMNADTHNRTSWKIEYILASRGVICHCSLRF